MGLLPHPGRIWIIPEKIPRTTGIKFLPAIKAACCNSQYYTETFQSPFNEFPLLCTGNRGSSNITVQTNTWKGEHNK